MAEKQWYNALLSGPRGGLRAPAPWLPLSRVVLALHGTGHTEAAFWTQQEQTLARLLGRAPRVYPVWWGDLIDAGARLPTARDRLTAHIHALSRRLRGRPARRPPRLVAQAAGRLHGLVNGAAGVIAYLIPTPTRELIRSRLRQRLAELTALNHDIVLVSESLGCLIAFDVLRAEAASYRIAAWVTLGCPLRTLVRTGQRSARLGAIRPDTVGEWWNLYAPLDPVAAPLASVFPTFPIRDECIEGATSAAQAHRYWASPRAAGLIAQVVRG